MYASTVEVAILEIGTLVVLIGICLRLFKKGTHRDLKKRIA